MKKLLLIFLILFMCIYAQADDLTGYNWRELNRIGKLCYILGVFGGISLVEITIIEMNNRDAEVIDGCDRLFRLGDRTAGNIRDDLDEYYEEYEKREIPIYMAIVEIYEIGWHSDYFFEIRESRMWK